MDDSQLGPQEPRTYHFCSIVDAPRMDVYLTHGFGHFSRSFFQHLLKDGHVLHNGQPAKAPQALRKGDILALTLPKLKTLDLVAEDIPLDILYEDEAMIVLNKAPGIVVHPTEKGGHYCGTIVNALLHYAPDSFSGIKGERRPGIVHRLDKDTSGVLVVAKTDQSLSRLSQQFQDRSTEKYYRALVIGTPTPSHGKIDAPIMRDPTDRKKMAVSGHVQARDALSEYWVEAEYKGYSLLKVRIYTGRTHQIRVHLAAIGHPILGDDTYGNHKANALFKKRYGLQRQFLHAAILQCTHPSTREPLQFEAPLSPDLTAILKKLD